MFFLGFSDIAPDDRHLKVAKSDSFEFLSLILFLVKILSIPKIG